MLNRRNIIAMFGAGVVSIVGYYVAEAIMYGNWVAALASMGPNLIQSAGSAEAEAAGRTALRQKNNRKRHQSSQVYSHKKKRNGLTKPFLFFCKKRKNGLFMRILTGAKERENFQKIW